MDSGLLFRAARACGDAGSKTLLQQDRGAAKCVRRLEGCWWRGVHDQPGFYVLPHAAEPEHQVLDAEIQDAYEDDAVDENPRAAAPPADEGVDGYATDDGEDGSAGALVQAYAGIWAEIVSGFLARLAEVQLPAPAPPAAVPDAGAGAAPPAPEGAGEEEDGAEAAAAAAPRRRRSGVRPPREARGAPGSARGSWTAAQREELLRAVRENRCEVNGRNHEGIDWQRIKERAMAGDYLLLAPRLHEPVSENRALEKFYRKHLR